MVRPCEACKFPNSTKKAQFSRLHHHRTLAVNLSMLLGSSRAKMNQAWELASARHTDALGNVPFEDRERSRQRTLPRENRRSRFRPLGIMHNAHSPRELPATPVL